MIKHWKDYDCYSGTIYSVIVHFINLLFHNIKLLKFTVNYNGQALAKNFFYFFNIIDVITIDFIYLKSFICEREK